jgi:hypothetical protein
LKHKKNNIAMKKLSTLLFATLFTACLAAQVEVGKAKNDIMGKGKLIASPVSELLIDHFHLTFNLYKFAEDEGGGGAQVGVRARLGGVDESLAQEITDEAYTYFVESWKKKNVTITKADKAVMISSKVYAKADKKGKAKIMSGEVFEDKQKKAHTMQAWPTGVDVASSGEGPLATYGNAKHTWLYGVGNSTSFNAIIDFIDFKTAKLGSTASVTSKPGLSLNANLAATIWEKGKVGGYIGRIETAGITDYYTEKNNDGMEFLGSKVVDDVYMIDRAKFKENVMEMIKKSIDAQFVDFDEVVAKNS